MMERLSGFGIPGDDADPVMRDLYARSSRLELPLLDYITIRDLLELGRCQDDGPLVAVLLTLFSALEEGSLCIDLEEANLRTRLTRFLDKDRAGKMAASFLFGLSRGKYKALIARHGHDYLPLILSAAQDGQLLYFEKFYVHETLLRERMETLLQAEPSLRVSEMDMDSMMETIYAPDSCVRTGKGATPIERDADQVEALRIALRSQFCIISGGPGTGKTSLMVNLLRCLVRAGMGAREILLGAPTGRASQRMSEAVQRHIHSIERPDACDRALLDLKGSTLHKLLRYRGSYHDFHYRETNPLPASAIILDEVSMVDIIMMERFLRAVDPSRTRLILLGDKDQLPSVEAGAVFAEMIPEGTRAERFKGRLVILKTAYRSGRNLTALAGEINQGVFPEHAPVPFASALHMGPDQWAVTPHEGTRAWRECIRQWVDHHYLRPGNHDGEDFRDLAAEAGQMDVGTLLHSESGKEVLGRIFQQVEQARILSLVRKGIYGCEGINREVAACLAPLSGRPEWAEKGCFPGAVIMITQNDYAKELFNGDVGVVVMDRQGAFRAVFPRSGAYVAYSVDMLPPWEPAFAMTVHKSQGSEFDHVLLVLPPDDSHRLLTREIVYTGVTRARKWIIIYGAMPALETALGRRIERRSGLGW